MKKISNMKISQKVIIPMILLLITVLMNGLGATINLQYVMDSGTEINHIHFTNVYNLEQINSNFERLQKLIYTHCVAEMIIVSAIACIVWLVVFVIIMKGIIAPLKATGQKLLEIFLVLIRDAVI